VAKTKITLAEWPKDLSIGKDMTLAALVPIRVSLDIYANIHTLFEIP